jgi:hypothetical protein
MRGPGRRGPDGQDSCGLTRVLAFTNRTHDKSSDKYAAAQLLLESGVSPMDHWGGGGGSCFQPTMIFEIVESRLNKDFQDLMFQYMPNTFMYQAFKSNAKEDCPRALVSALSLSCCHRSGCGWCVIVYGKVRTNSMLCTLTPTNR